MEITVKNLQRAIRIQPSRIQTAAQTVLKAHKVKDASLSFVFVSKNRSRQINQSYLNHDYPTDIITFDLSEPNAMMEGEIFICPMIARDNAKTYKNSVQKELTLYVVHGLLHLLGFDDKTDSDRTEMRKEEERMMKLIYN